jgi:hypothetical protein
MIIDEEFLDFAFEALAQIIDALDMRVTVSQMEIAYQPSPTVPVRQAPTKVCL